MLAVKSSQYSVDTTNWFAKETAEYITHTQTHTLWSTEKKNLQGVMMWHERLHIEHKLSYEPRHSAYVEVFVF